MPKITGLPQDSSPSTDDFTVTVDTTSGQAKKVSLADLATLVYNSLPAGVVVQVVGTNYSSMSTGATLIPIDDTIPQNTEGVEFMSQTITPKAASNTLIVEVNAFISCNTATRRTVGALFKDSTADALAVCEGANETATYTVPAIIRYSMTAGSTSAMTFKFRAGGEAGATVTFNGLNSARYYGTTIKSFIKITEVKV